MLSLHPSLIPSGTSDVMIKPSLDESLLVVSVLQREQDTVLQKRRSTVARPGEVRGGVGYAHGQHGRLPLLLPHGVSVCELCLPWTGK